MPDWFARKFWTAVLILTFLVAYDVLYLRGWKTREKIADNPIAISILLGMYAIAIGLCA